MWCLSPIFVLAFLCFFFPLPFLALLSSSTYSLWSFDKFHSVSRLVSLRGWSVPTPGKHTLQLSSIALERTTWVWLEWLPIFSCLVCGWCCFWFRLSFGLPDMRFIRQRSVQCDANIYREVAVDEVHPVPADVELFATFTIPQAEEADLCLCRTRAELVCGVVLRQTV